MRSVSYYHSCAVGLSRIGFDGQEQDQRESVCILLNLGTYHHFFREIFHVECLASWNSKNASTAPMITYFLLEYVSSASSAAYMHKFPLTFTAEQLQKGNF